MFDLWHDFDVVTTLISFGDLIERKIICHRYHCQAAARIMDDVRGAIGQSIKQIGRSFVFIDTEARSAICIAKKQKL